MRSAAEVSHRLPPQTVVPYLSSKSVTQKPAGKKSVSFEGPKSSANTNQHGPLHTTSNFGAYRLFVGVRPMTVANFEECDRVGVAAPGHLVDRLELGVDQRVLLARPLLVVVSADVLGPALDERPPLFGVLPLGSLEFVRAQS